MRNINRYRSNFHEFEQHVRRIQAPKFYEKVGIKCGIISVISLTLIIYIYSLI